MYNFSYTPSLYMFNKYILEYYRLCLLKMDFIFDIYKYFKLDAHQRTVLTCVGHLRPKYIRTMPWWGEYRARKILWWTPTILITHGKTQSMHHLWWYRTPQWSKMQTTEHRTELHKQPGQRKQFSSLGYVKKTSSL